MLICVRGLKLWLLSKFVVTVVDKCFAFVLATKTVGCNNLDLCIFVLESVEIHVGISCPTTIARLLVGFAVSIQNTHMETYNPHIVSCLYAILNATRVVEGVASGQL